MDGVRRIYIIQENRAKKIRAFLLLEDFKDYLKEKYSFVEQNLKVTIGKKNSTIKTERDYQKILNSAKFTPIEIHIPYPKVPLEKIDKKKHLKIGEKRRNHPNTVELPQKKIKKHNIHDLSYQQQSVFLCYAKYIRTFEIVDIRNDQKFTVRSDLLSKTSRTLCIGDDIIITGSRYYPTQALLLNLNTRKITAIASLNHGRYWHVMGFIDGLPAVIGGCEGEKKEKHALKTVEVLQNNK